jgi:hypothetical protein
MEFGHGAQYFSRWYRDPSSVFVAKQEGKLLDYVMLTNWGSFDASDRFLWLISVAKNSRHQP